VPAKVVPVVAGDDCEIGIQLVVIGTLDEFPNESSAQGAVDSIRLEINQQTPQQLIKNVSLDTLVNHYRQHELPDIFNKVKPAPDAAEEDRKSYATQVTYEGYLKKWIIPRWGACRLTDLKAVEVEKWLKTLCFKKTGIPLARGSKAKIRNIMSALYSHAIRWEWADKNPITSANGGIPLRLAPNFSLPWSRGLGVRIACEERKTAVLARYSLALLRQASSETSRNHEACDVSHFPALCRIWDYAECFDQRRRLGLSAHS
jgi:hypothetical protein